MRISYRRLLLILPLLAFFAQPLEAAGELRGGLVINEVLPDPNGANNFDTDGNGTAATTDEFVEIYNNSAGPISLDDIELWDAGVGLWFTFPAGSSIVSGGRAVVVCGVQTGGALPTVPVGSLAFDAGRTSGAVNNGGDNVVLYDPTADEYAQILYNGDGPDNPPVGYAGFSATATLVDVIEDWGSDSDGISLVRSPEGSDTVVQHDTVGTANASPGNPTQPPVPTETTSVSRLKSLYRP